MLTKKEEDAIRFYQGDVRKRIESVSFSEDEKETGFFGISGAYKTMNCLMFNGIDNEKERIAENVNSLNPQILLNIDKVVDVFYDIFRAMCKSVKEEGNCAGTQTLYRTDRGISVQEMINQGRTISFTSTSKINHPKKYFQKKKKLTLLELVMPPDVPHLDFERIFGSEYLFADQREILLPPFLRIHLFEGKLTKEEKKYKDADGRPPQGKYIVVLEQMDLPKQQKTVQERDAIWMKLKSDKEKMANFLEKMMRKEELTQQEKEEYCAWKMAFQEIVIEGFREIQREFLESGVSLQAQKAYFVEDIEKRYKEYSDRRKKYKRSMRIYNLLLAIVSVAPLVCMALSFMEDVEVAMKIASIITSAGAMILTRILKVEAYSLKLYQRAKTCLNIRDLLRQVKYEHHWSEEKLREYEEGFRTIMKEDADMSLQNLKMQMDFESKLFRDEIIS